MIAKKLKKAGSVFLAATMLAGLVQVPPLDVKAAGEVTQEQLQDNGTAAPEAWGALPSPNQYKYQKDELAGFCHFGPNTFSGVEWGESYGDSAPSEIFGLRENFDAETLVKSFHDAGFKKLIITAKHHDGFCIWNSAYTEYDATAAGYQGDVLEEISAACTKYDIDMGLYLSPWDIHDDSYGYYDADGNPLIGGNGQPLNGKTWEEVEELDALDYNEYYNNQLTEILGNKKYGNNGRFVEVWMDGAKGSGTSVQNYTFEKWFETIQKYQGKAAGYEDDCLLFGAASYTTVRWIGNELGIAPPTTWSAVKADREANTLDPNSVSAAQTKEEKGTQGFPDGNQWTVPECDARITSGWFWGANKCTPKSIAELARMYFKSVGRNATLLLNVPPNNTGGVDTAIKERLLEFGDNIRRTFATSLAEGATARATEVRGNDIAFAPANVLDGDDDTYWTMNDGTTTGSITLNLGGVKKFDVVSIEEAIKLGQRVSGFKVEYRVGGGQWQLFEEGTTIGAKRLCRQQEVRADEIKITITGSNAVPLISEIGVYKATSDLTLSTGIPKGIVNIDNKDKDITDGFGFIYEDSKWTQETGSQFVNNTSMWSNPSKGGTLQVKFHGTKIWLFGTKDSGHGTASIQIDDGAVETLNTKSSPRVTGIRYYESPTLPDGEHTLTLTCTSEATGIEAAAVLDNGGAGAVEFADSTITMEEDQKTQVLVRRVGGTTGELKVQYENNPGSAVQGNYDVDGIGGELVFADGETEKYVTLTTKRYLPVTGSLNFTADLINVTEPGLLGFNQTLKVVIRDMDAPERIDEAEALLAECEGLDLGVYKPEGANAVEILIRKLQVFLEARDMEQIVKLTNELRAAKEKLELDSDAAVTFPTKVGETRLIEAEDFKLDASGAAADKYVRIAEDANASGGKKVSWFETGNIISKKIIAAAGTYKVTATINSGRAQSNPNVMVWGGANIEAGTKNVWNNSNKAEFNVVVTASGETDWTFTANASSEPNIDKFEIEAIDVEALVVGVESISLDKSAATLTCDRPQDALVALVRPRNATNKNITFSTDRADLVTVNASGLIEAKEGVKGTAVVTATTEDGAKTATCTVTVDTIHKFSTWTVTKEPTCAQKGKRVSECSICHNTITEEIPVNPAKHEALKLVPAKASTATAEGNIAYWFCASCNKYFKDAAGTQGITKEQTVIPKIKEDGKPAQPNPDKKEYTITYKLNGGKNNTANPKKYTTQKVIFKNVNRKGFVFKGWYEDSKFKKKVTSVAGKNITVYAKWAKVTSKATKITSAKNNKKKQVALKYRKSSGVKGYEISYSTNKKFKKSVKRAYTNKKKYTIKKLKKGKTYYVRIRTYKMDSTGQKVYSKYSKVKKVTIKK